MRQPEGKKKARVAIVELAPEVLARARKPFPKPVRTLDGLHLASADILRASGAKLEIASYDDRLRVAAEAMGYSVFA